MDGGVMVSKIKGDATSTFGSDIDVAGNVVTDAPAFRAYMSSDTTISDATYTKVPLDTVLFDTTNDFDTTNYRFTPSVAGYYHINTILKFSFGSKIVLVSSLYKNGSPYELGEIWRGTAVTGSIGFNNNYLIYLNGSTDYVELYGYSDVSSGTATFDFANTTNGCFMSGFLARAV